MEELQYADLDVAVFKVGTEVFLAHRLDKPTSGVLLFALSRSIAKSLYESFAARRVRKTYLAVVRGYLDGEGVVDIPLRRVRDHRERSGGGQKAEQEELQSANTAYR